MNTKMEPMALGSPPSPTANNYLPSFLMGDPVSPTGHQTMSMVSPTRSKTPNYRLTPGAECKSFRQKLFKEGSDSAYNNFGTASIEKGPPKQGLFDSLESNKKVKTPILSSTMQPLAEHLVFAPNESFSRIGNESVNISHNENQNLMTDSFHWTNMQKQRNPVTHWITIFGFPPSTASVALSHFTNCGHILDKKFPTQGNYVHIKFSNPYEVNKALGMNGRLIMNNIMVGVVPYYPDEKENANVVQEITSPIRARSLRHSYVSPHMNTSLVASPNVPQKSTGIVTKAMEYVFGW